MSVSLILFNGGTLSGAQLLRQFHKTRILSNRSPGFGIKDFNHSRDCELKLIPKTNYDLNLIYKLLNHFGIVAPYSLKLGKFWNLNQSNNLILTVALSN